MEPAIQIEHLTRRFGSFTALDDVSFSVPARTLFGLLGPNGAGKTTLFSVVAGYLRPTAGTVTVHGTDSTQVSRLRGRLTVLPQDALFQGNMPILDQLILFSRLAGRSPQEAEKECLEALRMVGLEEYIKRSARVLSHGMTKRLGIAQAFLGNPDVIFLDEPTAGLDPANARMIRELIVSLQERATIVLSSHDLKEIQELCSHVAILHRGKLVTSGPVQEITRGHRSTVLMLARPLAPPEVAEIQQLPGMQSFQWEKETSYLLASSPECLNHDELVFVAMERLSRWKAYVRRMNPGASLESVFLDMTRESTEKTRA